MVAHPQYFWQDQASGEVQDIEGMFDNIPEIIHVELARVLLVVVVFVALLLLRNLIAWIIAKPVQRFLERIGQSDLDETIQRVVGVPMGYLLLALGLDIGARILEVTPGTMTFVVHVTRTLIIIAVVMLVYRLVRVLVFSRKRLLILTGLAVDEALLPFIRTGAHLIVLALALVIIIQEWGYDVTGLIAGLGLGGLALSLAAQDTLSNIFAFAAIVSDRPFVVGEYVKTKDVEGLIERVGLRSTRVRQIDQAIVAVPNSMLASSAILNWSRLSKRKVELTLGVSYRTHPDQMEALLSGLREMLKARDKVDPNSVVVYFVGIGQSSLNILVRAYLNIADWGEFSAEQERILLDILRLVESLGLQIAFPTQSIYLEATGGVPESIGIESLIKPNFAPIGNEQE
ncbi:MAG: mechanosensitive ion channel family protein [Chloroflexota bacterium]